MTAHLPQTPHSLLVFVADYLRHQRLYGAAARMTLAEAHPITGSEVTGICQEITDRDIPADSKSLALAFLRLVWQRGWPEIEVGMRALQSTKSSRAARDAMMAYKSPKETTP